MPLKAYNFIARGLLTEQMTSPCATVSKPLGPHLVVQLYKHPLNQTSAKEIEDVAVSRLPARPSAHQRPLLTAASLMWCFKVVPAVPVLYLLKSNSLMWCWCGYLSHKILFHT